MLFSASSVKLRVFLLKVRFPDLGTKSRCLFALNTYEELSCNALKHAYLLWSSCMAVPSRKKLLSFSLLVAAVAPMKSSITCCWVMTCEEVKVTEAAFMVSSGDGLLV